MLTYFNEVLEPGARGRFVGMLAAIVPAYYSMGGQEIIAMWEFLGLSTVPIWEVDRQQGINAFDSAAAETVNPRRNIAMAMRTVFFRILIFYVSSGTLRMQTLSNFYFLYRSFQ